MAKIDVTELDIFYISYDEPNCEEHWADLLNKVPWAKSVHGVKGFDKAHKTAAEQSETERFITVAAGINLSVQLRIRWCMNDQSFAPFLNILKKLSASLL